MLRHKLHALVHMLSLSLSSLSLFLSSTAAAQLKAHCLLLLLLAFFICRWRAVVDDEQQRSRRRRRRRLRSRRRCFLTFCASSFFMPAQLCTQAATVKRLETRTLVALSLLASLYLSLHLSLQLSFAASTPALFGLLHSFGSAVGALIYCLL